MLGRGIAGGLHLDPRFGRGGLVNPDPALRAEARRIVREAAEFAGSLGAHLIIWPGGEGYNYPFQAPYVDSFDHGVVDSSFWYVLQDPGSTIGVSNGELVASIAGTAVPGGQYGQVNASIGSPCHVRQQPLPAFDTRACSRCRRVVHPGCGSGQFPVFTCTTCLQSPPCPICLQPLTGAETKQCRKCGRTVHAHCGKRQLRGFVCTDDA